MQISFLRLAVAGLGAAVLAYVPHARAAEFEKAQINLERNMLDKDIEARIDVTSNGDGLTALKVTAPDGRVVLDVQAPKSKYAWRHLTLESPEPANDGKLQADFPAGTYVFEGTTTSGSPLRAEATLSHTLPPPAILEMPRAKQRDVPASGLTLRWKNPPDITGVVVVLEDEEAGHEIRVSLAGTATRLMVPEGFLRPRQKYTLAIGLAGPSGNRTFIETEFSTAGPQ